MRRLSVAPRPDFRQKLEASGMPFHTVEGKPYWHEAAYYRLTAGQVDTLEAATNDLFQMLLAAGQHVIDRKRYADLRIPEEAVALIESTWESEPPSIYCRLDLAYDGTNPPKLLEANADTPTMLFESSVAQWEWKEEVFPQADQFNSLHERLVKKWSELRGDSFKGKALHFAHCFDPENTEEACTVAYLMDTALQAGLVPIGLSMEDLGITSDGFLVDPDNGNVNQLFKLYPWEWLVYEDREQILRRSHATGTLWIEPIWKMLLSNKGILPILWELYPNHPLLLESHFDSPGGLREYVKKPLLSREGANVTVVADAGTVTTDGDYGEEGYVYQKFFDIPMQQGFRPVIGSWLVDMEAAGIGIRDCEGLVTDNTSLFTPHLFA